MSSRPEAGILIIVGALSDRGGLQRWLTSLASALAEHHPVTFLTWSPLFERLPRPRIPGVEVVVVPSLARWDREQTPPVAALNTVFSVCSALIAALRLRRRWSVAVAAGLHPEATVATLAAGRRAHVVAATWLVGPLGNVERLARSPMRVGVLRLLQRVSAFVAETQQAADELLSLGVDANRIEMIMSGVDLRRFRPREAQEDGGPRRIVYAGRFDLRQKRLDLLLDAWERSPLEGWALVLAGTGPDESTIRRRSAALNDVEVHDWREDVDQLLRSADAFVLPTNAETSALALLEGMACGLPGIVSATPGNVARAPAGVQLAKNDRQSWSAALSRLDALGPDGRAEAGRRARAWAEDHADADKAHRRWLALVERLSRSR